MKLKVVDKAAEILASGTFLGGMGNYSKFDKWFIITWTEREFLSEHGQKSCLLPMKDEMGVGNYDGQSNASEQFSTVPDHCIPPP